MGKTKSKKKILIYSPYWQILGGGERYLLQIAAALQNKYSIFLIAPSDVKKKAWDVFGIKLKKVEFLDPSKFKSHKFYGRYLFVRQFDILFYMTDGSLFFPAAHKNYLIIQSPAHLPKLDLATRFKISGWKIVCYSSFMQKIINDRLNCRSIILSPAVDIGKFRKYARKEKIFLTVGRFFTSFLHEKKPDFLVNFFRRNFNDHFKGWQLYICGNVTEKSGQELFNLLKKTTRNLPVKLLINLPFSKLLEIYRKSSIYWHAAGVGFDPEKFPEKMEHFGITTIESMASGCVPVVYAAGGQVDIVGDGQNGFLWQDEDAFLEENLKLVKDRKLMAAMSKNARKRAADFSFKKFRQKVYELV